MNPEAVWEFEHSVDCATSPYFAWNYWSNVENWDDPPAEFQIDGPFQPGARITATSPGQDPWLSVIREVLHGRAATIEMQLPGAALSSRWTFADSPTRNGAIMTQRLTLSGPNAAEYLDQVSILERTVPEDMKKLASTIDQANAEAKSKGKRTSR